MKILILSWRDIKHPWKGGSEIYLHEIAKKLVESGHQVTYFSSAHPGGSLPREKIDGVDIIRKGNMYTVYLWAAWYYLRYFRHRFDVILDQHNGIPFFSPAYVTSTPVICLFHHVHLKQWSVEFKFPIKNIGYLLEKYLLPLTYRYNHFIAVSPSTKQDLIDKLGINPDNIFIVPNAVGSFITKTIPKTTFPSLIYLGRLKKYKKIDVLIRSLLRILYKYPNLKLHIVGSGDQKNEYIDLTERLGIAKSVIFHGFVSDKLKVDLLSSAWIHVNPSQNEGWGISVIEAAACGTTSVGSNTSGLKDSIVDHETGLLFDNGSVHDLSQKIDQILSNPGLRYRLEKNAIHRASKFTWQNSANKMIKIFKQNINQKMPISNFQPIKSSILKNKKRSPLVSIIIPTKNVAAFVDKCFASIARQTYSRIELIVVDNYSTDGTYQIAKKYTDKVYSYGPERNQQRNYAVSKAKGKYLLFIDSDMTLEENMVADCVYRLERFGKSVAVILPELQVGKTIWSQARRLEKEFYLGDDTIESPRFFRRSIYLKSGGYDENLLYAEDMELTSRIRQYGHVTRSVFYIYHDEDRLTWWDIIRKKYFYGQSAKYYFAKNADHSDSSQKIGFKQKLSNFVNNPIVSLSTGFLPSKKISAKSSQTTKFIRPAFIKNWHKFLDNPFISVMFFFLRTTELTSMGFGYLISLLRPVPKKAEQD